MADSKTDIFLAYSTQYTSPYTGESYEGYSPLDTDKDGRVTLTEATDYYHKQPPEDPPSLVLVDFYRNNYYADQGGRFFLGLDDIIQTRILIQEVSIFEKSVDFDSLVAPILESRGHSYIANLMIQSSPSLGSMVLYWGTVFFAQMNDETTRNQIIAKASELDPGFIENLYNEMAHDMFAMPDCEFSLALAKAMREGTIAIIPLNLDLLEELDPGILEKVPPPQKLPEAPAAGETKKRKSPLKEEKEDERVYARCKSKELKTLSRLKKNYPDLPSLIKMYRERLLQVH